MADTPLKLVFISRCALAMKSWTRCQLSTATRKPPPRNCSSIFSVANLTTFTSLKEINDSSSLRAYIGFFAFLWLTWFSNSLYDVRFTIDCIFERCAKLVHFGVMVGFAVVGPAWEPGKATYSLQKYDVLSFILMVSRLVLAAQYSVTL
jgi:hypothetical protein